MKWWVIAIIVVVVVGITAAIGIPMSQGRVNAANEAAAKTEYQNQLQDKWSKVAEMVSLLPMRTSNSKTLRNFAAFEYKELNALKPFRVDSTFKNQASDFMDKVHDPAMKLLRQLVEKFKVTDKSLVLERARDMDQSLRKFRENNSDVELRNIDQVAPILEGKFDKLAEAIEPPKPTVVYVNQYPDWVTTREQRTSYSSMRDIARRYLQSRMGLAKRLNWNRAKSDSSYLRQSDVRSIISDAWNLRKEMRNELAEASRVEGMSELASMIDQMLVNSLEGLAAIYDHADYPTFKSLNNANDRLAQEIRRKYGVEMW